MNKAIKVKPKETLMYEKRIYYSLRTMESHYELRATEESPLTHIRGLLYWLIERHATRSWNMPIPALCGGTAAPAALGTQDGATPTVTSFAKQIGN